MPAKPGKIPVRCPHCGHEQSEPRTAISTVCKKCRRHFRLEDTEPASASALVKPSVAVRRVRCFDCGTELEPPAAAQNTMCKRCSSYVDLRDYEINNAVSRNFRTAGRFVVEEKGYVFNADVTAADVVLKGRFLGKITAGHSLTIFSTAEIKGSLHASRLIIPVGQHFSWHHEIEADQIEIEGDFIGPVRTRGTIRIAATGRLFGDATASNIVVERGAVWVGTARIGTFAPGNERS